MEKEPFMVAVSDETLADLRERLAKTRWPDEVANAHWEYGTNLAYLQELVAYWRDGYNWRRHERTINAFPHYRVTIDGVPIHFIHQPGRGPKISGAGNGTGGGASGAGPDLDGSGKICQL